MLHVMSPLTSSPLGIANHFSEANSLLNTITKNIQCSGYSDAAQIQAAERLNATLLAFYGSMNQYMQFYVDANKPAINLHEETRPKSANSALLPIAIATSQSSNSLRSSYSSALSNTSSQQQQQQQQHFIKRKPVPVMPKRKPVPLRSGSLSDIANCEKVSAVVNPILPPTPPFEAPRLSEELDIWINSGSLEHDGWEEEEEEEEGKQIVVKPLQMMRRRPSLTVKIPKDKGIGRSNTKTSIIGTPREDSPVLGRLSSIRLGGHRPTVRSIKRRKTRFGLKFRS